MYARIVLTRFAAGALLCAAVTKSAESQDAPPRRLANIVGVAVSEYGLAVDEQRRVISTMEFDEAVAFLGDARALAVRLTGDRAPTVQALVDSLALAVAARETPAAVGALHLRFVQALGADGALELPSAAVDFAAGQAIYQRDCASCHGALGRGDGPAAAGLDPAPPAFADAEAMRDVTPALMYRIVSVGVQGTAMAGWAGTLSPDQRWNVVAYLNTLRTSAAAAARGGALLAGRGGAPLDFAWQAERSDAQIALALRNGETGASPLADAAPAEVWAAVAHVRATAAQQVAAASGAVAAGDPGAIAATVRAIVAEVVRRLDAGDRDGAGDQAFDAYLAFEPLETPARARAPGRVAEMERHFAELRAAAKAGDAAAARTAAARIDLGLPGVLELVGRAPRGWAAFLQSFLIIVREGFEAILVIGAIVALLVKTGHRARLRTVWVGVGAGLVASAALAVVLATVLKTLPATREVIEGATMLVATAVLFSVSYWLISKAEAAQWQRYIKQKVDAALARGGGGALAAVAFLAVFREGAETALFYQALLQGGAPVVPPLLAGLAAGAAVLAVVFTGFYRFGVRLPLGPFFAVTGGLLYALAFIFAGKGVRELQEGGAVSLTALPGVPHVELLGVYATVETLLAQGVLVVALAYALWRTLRERAARRALAPAGPTIAERVTALEQRVEGLAARDPVAS
jgi:high-affinity iron transporter